MRRVLHSYMSTIIQDFDIHCNSKWAHSEQSIERTTYGDFVTRYNIAQGEVIRSVRPQEN